MNSFAKSSLILCLIIATAGCVLRWRGYEGALILVLVALLGVQARTRSARAVVVLVALSVGSATLVVPGSSSVESRFDHWISACCWVAVLVNITYHWPREQKGLSNSKRNNIKNE